MLTFADIGIPPWDIAPILITGSQIGFVASALVEYAARSGSYLNNQDAALQRAGVAITQKAKGRIVIELIDQAGTVLDFVPTSRRLASHNGGLSQWVSRITPVFHEAFGAFDAADVYANCVTHYEVQSSQWMPLPEIVKAEFVSWSMQQQAMFLHYFVWWYDRDYYREKPGIEAALAYLKERRLHLGRWQFTLREHPHEQSSSVDTNRAAYDAVQTIVGLFEEAVNDPEALPYVSPHHVPNAWRLRLKRFHEGFAGLDPRRGPKSSDVLRALGRDSHAAKLPELLLSALWNAQWWRDEPEVPRLHRINTLAAEIESLATRALEAGW